MNGRIILQDLLNHTYLSLEETWVESCQQARVFEHTYQALLEGLQHTDRHSQVVWCFQNPSENMYVLVRPENKDRIFPCENCPLACRATRDAEQRALSARC